MPVPALKTRSIFQQIQPLWQGESQATQMDLALLSREAASIKSKDIVQGLVLEGLLAVLSHNADIAHQKFKGAISASGGSHEVRNNYINALFSMGEMQRCVQEAMELHASGLTIDTNMLMGAGAYAKANEINNSAYHAHSSEDTYHAEKVMKTQNTPSVQETLGIGCDRIINAVTRAGKFVWSKGFHLIGGVVGTVDGEILHTLLVPQFIDDQIIIEMEWEMDNLFVEDAERIQLHGIFIELLASVPEKNQIVA
ncbi:hypothetical protein A6M27_01210 [Acidithiobacillus thiooxidans]|uniref:Uncharacterized protein n=1 Tax=Acidithiobacillus thiooxidans TaxID=930 RepID=A0A1C2IFI2_ACITH|nr:hypothetical protein [Acidithiobacillus thiooxidans]OCX72479.1 hypothetical protein A6P07_09780 [Acidithiobacillus thiooxidans]OCX73091.1 hypothetical protein A6O24_12570 [Acidithiobacillus thiooxidans]OCX74744.1 hypothetical protein A6M23_05085 [Acidithiobacillus thiooxidans]OCX83585.1 hypothetical protein A6O26_06750 [Acidithiobacillus thiooxidans]OCX86949.1 hypothetical protein A6P08_04565 [Acidithiobacillus thiooxidans]